MSAQEGISRDAATDGAAGLPLGRSAGSRGKERHFGGGWRYVLLELAIVTAGLFIALMLNGAVEWSRHRQIVHDARRNLHKEISENRKKIRENLGYVQSSMRKVDSNISALHLMLAGRFHSGSLGTGIDFDAFDETAWLTARDTQALSYMPYDEVQRYSGLYTMIEYVNARELVLVDSQFDAMSPAVMGYDISHLPKEDVKSMLRGNAQAKIKLEATVQLLNELDQQLDKAAREGA